MANSKAFCFIFINILVVCNGISAFSDILDNAHRCEEKCTKSYAPHTYPHGDENSACERGCRLYTVTKFISSDEPKPITNDIDDDQRSPALILCHRSCVEAYNETSALKDACQAGCGKQENISMELDKIKEEKDSLASGIHLLTPVMQVREVTSKIIGMLRIVQTSLTTYFKGENNEMIAVEGPVQVMIQIHRPDAPINSDNSAENLEIEETPFAGSFKRDSVVKVPVEESNGLKSFYNEISRFDFVTYAIMSGMLLAVMFLIYLMIARRNKYIKKSHRMNVTAVIPAHALPVKLVRPEDLTKLSLMDEEEAPELPVKVRLPDNTSI